MTTTPSKGDILRYKKSFVDWSESAIGFRPEKRWNQRTQMWEASVEPIRWVPQQRRWLEHALTYGADGNLPYDEIWVVDIGKSGKTMINAAVAQWFGMFGELPGEIIIAANSREHSKVRAFKALQRSIQLSPVPYTKRMTDQEIEWLSGNVARAVPLKAQTQAGADSPLVTMDEVWAYTTDTAQNFFSEAKSSPTLNVSLRLITTYPGYKQDESPMNDMLDLFFDAEGELQKYAERVPGLEDLPLYRIDTSLLWWNHDPYPWHEREIKGKTFLERERLKFKGRENEFKRIWQAQHVSREDSFISPVHWYACEDADHSPIGPHDRGIRGVLGLDVGVYRDSTACVFRGYDVETKRYPLLTHKIWRPRVDLKTGEKEVRLAEVTQWILDLIRKQEVIAIYYDQSQAAYIKQTLEDAIQREGLTVRLEKVEQGRRRAEADMMYSDLITTGVLRNYPQSADLAQHVLDATARYTKGGDFRLDKSSQSEKIKIDAAVADSQACLGVTENIDEFVWARRRTRPQKSAMRNPYREAYA